MPNTVDVCVMSPSYLFISDRSLQVYLLSTLPFAFFPLSIFAYVARVGTFAHLLHGNISSLYVYSVASAIILRQTRDSSAPRWNVSIVL